MSGKKVVTVRIAYTFHLEYGHEEHKQMMLDDLRKVPSRGFGGAGVAKDGKAYGFRSTLVGVGNVIEVEPDA